MKKYQKIIALAMAVITIVLAFAACGGNKAKIVVAEKGSAGEAVMNENAYFADFTKTPVDTQQKTLTEVKSGTADMAVIDYVMSIGSIGEEQISLTLRFLRDKSSRPSSTVSHSEKAPTRFIM